MALARLFIFVLFCVHVILWSTAVSVRRASGTGHDNDKRIEDNNYNDDDDHLGLGRGPGIL